MRQNYKLSLALLIPPRAIVLHLPINQFTNELELKVPSDVLKIAPPYL